MCCWFLNIDTDLPPHSVSLHKAGIAVISYECHWLWSIFYILLQIRGCKGGGKEWSVTKTHTRTHLWVMLSYFITKLLVKNNRNGGCII